MSSPIRFVPIPDPFQVPAESDGFGNFMVEPGNHGVIRAFPTSDWSMNIQC